MTVLTFPTNPTNGQRYSAPNGIQYVYDGVKWVVETTSSSSGAITNAMQDRVAPMFVDGDNAGITFAYNAATNVMSASVTAVNGNRLVNGDSSFSVSSDGTLTLTHPPESDPIVHPLSTVLTVQKAAGNYHTISGAYGLSLQATPVPSGYGLNTNTNFVDIFHDGISVNVNNNTWAFGTDGDLTLPNSGTINDYVGSAGVLGILIDRTFQTPNNANSANFGTDTVKLLLSDGEAAEIVSYLTASIGVRVWFNQGNNYPITSCVQVSTGIWTVTATGMGNTFATFAASNPLIFIYTGATPNTYTNFPQYVPVGDGAGITISKGGNSWTFDTDGVLTFPNGGKLGNPYGDGAVNLSGNQNLYAGLASYDTKSWAGVVDATYGPGGGIPAGGGFFIQTNVNVDTKTWAFKTDGGLVFPDATTQTTAYTGGGTTSYTPDDTDNWNEPAVNTISAALDELAARVTALQNFEFDGGNAYTPAVGELLIDGNGA